MTRWRIALAIGAFLAVAAQPGVTVAQDRPDLDDFSVTSIQDKSHATSSWLNKISSFVVDQDAGAGTINAYGQAYYFNSFNNNLTVSWLLYEPDKILRKPGKVQLQQGAYVQMYIHVQTASSSFGAYDTAQGCKAKLQFKDGDGDGIPDGGASSGADKTKWKIQCSTNALLGLGLNPAQVQTLQTLVSAKGFGHGSTLVSGSTR